ncbi:Oidioi.mRNA.OKI2018_I69.chr2.g7440.t1.cds [Oikopleura dioica]|uniref:Oidioi.mRNA.OKI2018_I69.chr2.g7440.t1.cds n=1 Tax=Oikopleura dioica TaxID=34765 RepID=A0ABN7TC61_OIKDI|nr:Oidioi.mRNA.OKI2018_I69.chr2.g7440.t1.cds [Oikopleura dioica]
MEQNFNDDRFKLDKETPESIQSPYGDIQTNRNQNRYSAPSLNNPRARYSTEYDHRFSTEIPVNAAHPQNDSAYKLERIRQNIGGSNGAALNRYSQGSTDALCSPKTDKEKENAKNVVTRAVSQKMPSDPFPKFTDEMSQFVKSSLAGKNANDIVSEIPQMFVTKSDMETLNESTWIDGEVINFYLKLIEMRSQTLSTMPRIKSLSSFFYTKLKEHGPNSVKRWTKKFNIFQSDLVFFPINMIVPTPSEPFPKKPNHWTLAYADMRRKRLCYLDSLGAYNTECVTTLFEYLKAEHLLKQEKPLSQDWKIESIAENIPRQMNNFDCGIFAMTFAEYLSRDAVFAFTQKHASTLRKLIAYQILQKKLLL